MFIKPLKTDLHHASEQNRYVSKKVATDEKQAGKLLVNKRPPDFEEHIKHFQQQIAKEERLSP